MARSSPSTLARVAGVALPPTRTATEISNKADFARALIVRPPLGRSKPLGGVVTLPWREREVSAPQELSGRCDCSPPRGGSSRRAARR